MFDRFEYQKFIEGKRSVVPPSGFQATVDHPMLFPFQRDIVRWALERGKAATFLDTGLGKTRVQLVWAEKVCEKTGGDVLVVAPLAVAQQTISEGRKVGIDVHYCRSQDDVRSGISITNYEMLEHFDGFAFDGVVLDESSRIKSFEAKTRQQVIAAFARTPYRLACTATPAPNDYMELGNHSEFLGVMSRTEMLSMYFIHDGGSTSQWRLKGHARAEFWRWVATWAVAMRSPVDLGYDGSKYALPPLQLIDHVVDVDTTGIQGQQASMFFEAQTLLDQRSARKLSMADRVRLAAEIVASEPDEQWAIWCELNDESAALAAAIPGAVEVRGSDTIAHKEASMVGFASGEVRVLVSKPSICGFGMNWQQCARTIFVGVSHSFEATYQAIRRFWRFGQEREVMAHLIYSSAEGAVARNLRRKEADAYAMQDAMIEFMREVNDGGLKAQPRMPAIYRPHQRMEVPRWM